MNFRGKSQFENNRNSWEKITLMKTNEMLPLHHHHNFTIDISAPCPITGSQ